MKTWDDLKVGDKIYCLQYNNFGFGEFEIENIIEHDEYVEITFQFVFDDGDSYDENIFITPSTNEFHINEYNVYDYFTNKESMIEFLHIKDSKIIQSHKQWEKNHYKLMCEVTGRTKEYTHMELFEKSWRRYFNVGDEVKFHPDLQSFENFSLKKIEHINPSEYGIGVIKKCYSDLHAFAQGSFYNCLVDFDGKEIDVCSGFLVRINETV